MESSGDPPLPLAGFHVLDLTRFLDRPAPWLGQHTAQVLRDELGVSGAELEELTRAGIAYDKHPEAGQ
jgi:crotonobetainyl-CoA:carnitine CoA-transferase CaiB-like acyl-CoA transferase